MRFLRALPALCLLVSFANAQDLLKLLRPVSEQATRSARIAPPRQGLEVHRSRFAEIDQNAFLRPVEGQRMISLELFSDTRFEAVEKQASGARINPPIFGSARLRAWSAGMS